MSGVYAMFLIPVLALSACGIPAKPFDLVVASNVDLASFEAHSILQVRMEAQSGSVASQMPADAECLLDPGYCELVPDASGMGGGSLTGIVWLDLDGDDDGDPQRALLDHDLIGDFRLDVRDLPYDHPLEVVLDEPEAIYDAE